MYNRSKKAQEKENSRLAESLSQFGNVKNEFIVSGRTVAKEFIQERRFDEAIRQCDIVLAVGPEDVETCDLKERAIVYLNNPDQFDLHEMQKNMEKQDGESTTPLRLLRSASERRHRSSAPAVVEKSATNGIPSDKNNNATAIYDENSGPTEQPVKLRRTRSEVQRPNVLERIKEFERQAKNQSNGINELSPASIRSEGLKGFTSMTTPKPVEPSENSHSNSALDVRRPSPATNSFPKSPIEEQSSQTDSLKHAKGIANLNEIPSRLPRKTGMFLPTSPPKKEIPASPTMKTQSPVFSLLKPKTETLSPVAEDDISQSQKGETIVSSLHGKPIVKWTELGKTVNANLRSQLEVNFFSSNLIKKVCITTTNAEIWACYGWTHVRKSEFETLLAGMSEERYLTSSPLRLDGIDFRCLSGTNTVVRARVNKLGVNCTKLKNILVIVIYEHPVLPKEVAMLVRRFGEILVKNQP